MRVLLGLLVCMSLGSCSKGQVCTEIGCTSGVKISLEKATAWAPGQYSFVFDLDGVAVNCSGALPLKNCEAGASLVCDVAERLQVGEVGCALGPAEQGFGDIQIFGAPRAVTFKLVKDDAPLHEARLAPQYATRRPNGADCPPECSNASERVVLP